MTYAAIGQDKTGRIKFVVLWNIRAGALLFAKQHGAVKRPKLKWRVVRAGRASEIWPYYGRSKR
jgi:hypothetical protein